VHGVSVLMALRDAVKAAGGNTDFDAPATAECLLMALQR